ncbi:MAG: DeoR/GlpR family DNA-binding transcription regulator, partial [Propionicimonas sp.]|nr:DeoR/GlpR family DNA-binding transcription regulator [Propionicimonas sp.]
MTGDRRSRILEFVIDSERVDVNELADRFAVSRVTVRKDLDELEKKGLVRREHGYAVAIARDNLLSRLAFHYDVKRRIAAAAASLVADGSTVMIESGSCCALLAEAIAETRKGVTLITNSAFIADYVRAAAGVNVVLLGGDYQPEAQVTVGPLVEQGVANFFVDTLFVGVDGYTEASGFTAANLLRAEAVRAMARRAREVVVLTESLKFPRQGAVQLLPVT